MQQLWQLGLQWDDPLPCDIVDSWQMFSDELPLVEKIKIPRYLQISDLSYVQLLGFSDASEKGYAAVIYLRIVHNDNRISVHFLTAKSKVATVKMSKCDSAISIPRLELCGTLLLVQTVHRVIIIIVITFCLSGACRTVFSSRLLFCTYNLSH